MDIQEIFMNHKLCSKCNIVKNKIDFDKLRGECKLCRKEFNKKYYVTKKQKSLPESLPITITI
jgi:hypothetical protein